MTSVTRRSFLVGAAAVACRPEADRKAPGESPAPPSPFVHGVASGDPLADRVILWTRITAAGVDEVEVAWKVARDDRFADVVAHGVVKTSAARDFTVKADAGGLQPGTAYHYAFEALGATSAIGRTKTLPVGAVSRMRLAFTSCSNYPYGYFNVYAAIAAHDDLDVVLHLGDYIYEYAEGVYDDRRLVDRAPEPTHETVTLADYRQRHALYKRDPDLQAAHGRYPFVTVWDDHESANDAWRGGAENHSPEEGEWDARKRAAVQAYMEWMPIRERGRDATSIERAFRFGDLVDLVMLDARLAGRDEQLERDDAKGASDPSRSLLGAAQERWLAESLVRSRDEGIAWRLIGQQVVMGHLRQEDGAPWTSDMWDGYDAARRRFLDHLDVEKIRDVVILSGDVHSSWAVEVCRDPFADDERERGRLAVELVTPAVSSPPPIPPEEAIAVAQRMTSTHPHVRWVDFQRRGYVVVDVDRERVHASWMHVATVQERDPTSTRAHEAEVRRGKSEFVRG